MKKTIMQTIITAVMGFLTSIFGALAIPILLMVACNIIDYGTGLAAAKYRSQHINSYKGLRGIIKKVSMWLLVAVGAVIDQLLLYASTTVGFKIPFSFLVAGVVAIWIICNEIISILENIKDIGVPIPSFLLPLTKNIKSHVSKMAGEDEKMDYFQAVLDGKVQAEGIPTIVSGNAKGVHTEDVHAEGEYAKAAVTEESEE